MSGKFLARVSAMSLAVFLAGCGGDESSSPLVDAGSGDTNTVTDNTGDPTAPSEDGDVATVSLELGTGSDANFQTGQMAVSASNPSLGETTRLSFNVVNASDGNKIYNAEATSVSISSLCETSVFDTPVTSASGSFAVSYEAGCSGNDTITARLENGATAIANISVAPPEDGSLEFISVDPDSIALAGSGNSARGSTSKVTFKLTNTSDVAISGAPVSFSISTTVGGVSLSQESSETSPDGTVSTTLNAGTVPTVVSVTATHTLPDGSVLQSTSDPISISAAIPDQDSFSLSIDLNTPLTLNARNYDGVEVPLTIRAADRYNNRVDGAVVNFLTNAGSIQSECILEDGACTVTWRSQNPRPDSGLIVILARTAGEESFRDLNSDGKYTQAADLFDLSTHDKGEAYLDRNWNQQKDSEEEYFDYNSNGQYDTANGIYNGTACADAETACTTNLLEVADSRRLFMASDLIDAIIVDGDTNDATPEQIEAPGKVCTTVTGVFQTKEGQTITGPVPGGTKITFTTTNGSLLEPASFTTPNGFTDQPVTYCVTAEADTTPSTGTIIVEVTPPTPYFGEAYTFPETITD